MVGKECKHHFYGILCIASCCTECLKMRIQQLTTFDHELPSVEKVGVQVCYFHLPFVYCSCTILVSELLISILNFPFQAYLFFSPLTIGHEQVPFLPPLALVSAIINNENLQTRNVT